MATTYTLITSTTLTGSQASVSFSSIPATYTDLCLQISARSDDTSLPPSGNILAFQFNSNGANYSATELKASNATANSTRWSAQSNQYSGLNGYDGANNTASTFSSFEIYIPSYTVSQNKTSSSFMVAENNSAGSNNIAATAQLWGNTAAITSVVFTNSNATNFVSGSTFYLYGIKNS